jgi:hypothetical protein
VSAPAAPSRDVMTTCHDPTTHPARHSATINGLASGAYELHHRRVDADHSNIVRTWEDLGRPGLAG